MELACDSRALGASFAVHLLAERKRPAIPELVRILTSNASRDVMAKPDIALSQEAEQALLKINPPLSKDSLETDFILSLDPVSTRAEGIP